MRQGNRAWICQAKQWRCVGLDIPILGLAANALRMHAVYSLIQVAVLA